MMSFIFKDTIKQEFMCRLVFISILPEKLWLYLCIYLYMPFGHRALTILSTMKSCPLFAFTLAGFFLMEAVKCSLYISHGAVYILLLVFYILGKYFEKSYINVWLRTIFLPRFYLFEPIF